MKENQRIILIIGASLALLELLCPPYNSIPAGRYYFGFSAFTGGGPAVDYPRIAYHLAIIGIATLLAYLVSTSTTIARWWAKFLYDPSNPS